MRLNWLVIGVAYHHRTAHRIAGSLFPVRNEKKVGDFRWYLVTFLWVVGVCLSSVNCRWRSTFGSSSCLVVLYGIYGSYRAYVKEEIVWVSCGWFYLSAFPGGKEVYHLFSGNVFSNVIGGQNGGDVHTSHVMAFVIRRSQRCYQR